MTCSSSASDRDADHGLAVGFAADIANMSLDQFAIDAEILYFCEIGFVTWGYAQAAADRC
ncbi:MAG TPA: hypothetical protein VI320_00380 [Terracidiphilus sp.]